MSGGGACDTSPGAVCFVKCRQLGFGFELISSDEEEEEEEEEGGGAGGVKPDHRSGGGGEAGGWDSGPGATGRVHGGGLG